MTTIPPFGAGDLPSASDEVLQLIILNGDEQLTAKIDTVIRTASTHGDLIDARMVRSADGERVVIGLRWRNAEAMSNNAISTASALGPAGERSDEPVVLFLGNELRRDGAVDILTNDKPR